MTALPPAPPVADAAPPVTDTPTPAELAGLRTVALPPTAIALPPAPPVADPDRVDTPALPDTPVEALPPAPPVALALPAAADTCTAGTVAAGVEGAAGAEACTATEAGEEGAGALTVAETGPADTAAVAGEVGAPDSAAVAGEPAARAAPGNAKPAARTQPIPNIRGGLRIHPPARLHLEPTNPH